MSEPKSSYDHIIDVDGKHRILVTCGADEPYVMQSCAHLFSHERASPVHAATIRAGLASDVKRDAFGLYWVSADDVTLALAAARDDKPIKQYDPRAAAARRRAAELQKVEELEAKCVNATRAYAVAFHEKKKAGDCLDSARDELKRAQQVLRDELTAVGTDLDAMMKGLIGS